MLDCKLTFLVNLTKNFILTKNKKHGIHGGINFKKIQKVIPSKIWLYFLSVNVFQKTI